jgi:hypothetical protein
MSKTLLWCVVSQDEAWHCLVVRSDGAAVLSAIAGSQCILPRLVRFDWYRTYLPGYRHKETILHVLVIATDSLSTLEVLTSLQGP